jgi:alginate O-acetyltransferase complex protein AlgI
MDIKLKFLAVASINLIIIFWGFLIIKQKMILISWLLFVCSIILVHFLVRSELPVIRMLALIGTTFTGMKVIAVAESYKLKSLTLSFKQWLSFAIGWVGMRAQPFEALGNKQLPNAWSLIRFGFSRILFGVLLLVLAHKVVMLPVDTHVTFVLVSVILLVGLSFILHFGLLSISAGTWRLVGVNTNLLFREPARSLSLTEFWSKRWNLAFTEMTSVAIYAPLKNRIGSAGAIMLAFMFSGLLHEVALSVPVNNGYGLPLLYFTIQGILVLTEKTLIAHKNKFLQHKITSRIWVFLGLVIPLPLLFHTQFLKQIVWTLSGLNF